MVTFNIVISNAAELLPRLKVPQPRYIEAEAKLSAFYLRAVSIGIGKRVVGIIQRVMLLI
jgi:hypothetical protein